MNLSKLVADDVPLFLSLLKDIFPRQADPPKKLYREVEAAVLATIQKNGLILSDEFLIKIMQLYEVRKERQGKARKRQKRSEGKGRKEGEREGGREEKEILMDGCVDAE